MEYTREKEKVTYKVELLLSLDFIILCRIKASFILFKSKYYYYQQFSISKD